MGNLYLSFGAWGYLALLAVVPVLWWRSWRGLAALGGARRTVVLLARTLVLALLVLALAEVQMVRKSDRLTVLYLLDESASTPPEQRSAMLGYVNASVRKHRRADDRAGVIVFARDAAVEAPARADNLEMTAVENALDDQRTSLAGAVKLALACFPEDSAKRIVLVSDGNENLGSVRDELRRAAGAGVDVVPARYTAPCEVVLDRLVIPGDVRRGQPFDVRAVVTNLADGATGAASEVRGRLVVSQSSGGKSRVVSDEPVVLPPGKKVFTVRQQIDEADFYTYEARFVPDKAEQDVRLQNNRATGFAHVRGKGRILLIEDQEHPGEYERMARQLRLDGLEVSVRAGGAAFAALGDLQAFDAVVLASAPREQFTDEQIGMLARNTQQFGSGLVMVGGPGSFGPGGWTGTEVETAMPVDFQIENAKVSPVGALLLVIDSSGSMTGEKVELCKAAAIASAKTLGPRDYVGCITFNVAARWVAPVARASNIEAFTRRVRRIGADGGTFMMPAMLMARKGLSECDAAIKHMIVLTDGQTSGSGADYERLAREMAQEKITVSTVAVGPDAAAELLRAIAEQGGGKFYRVQNPKTLPKIFMQEARRVSRPLIFDRFAVSPQIESAHEILAACSQDLPPVKGYILTTRKESPLVEICAATAQPSGKQYGTILAAWQYGLGRSVALTTDAGARWAGSWWENQASAGVFTQSVRWAMRPSGEAANFSVAAEMDGDKVRMVVSALDTQDAFLNFLQISGSVVGPDLKPVGFPLEQTAPGRYIGTFPVKDAGPYFVVVNHSQAGTAPILYGLNVPPSEEYRDRAENGLLLDSLVQGATPGMLIEGLGTSKIDSLLAADSFRRDGLPEVTFRQDVWPWAVFFASCVFLGDVFFRRVQVSFGWVGPLAARATAWVLRRKAKAASTPMIERLRSRKAEINEQMEALRAGARFSAPEGADARLPDLELPAELPQPQDARPALTAAPSATTYTERLLEAKRKAIKPRADDQPDP